MEVIGAIGFLFSIFGIIAFVQLPALQKKVNVLIDAIKKLSEMKRQIDEIEKLKAEVTQLKTIQAADRDDDDA